MLRRLFIHFCLLSTILSLQLFAAGGDELIARLEPTGSITDKANLLSATQEKRLRGILDGLEAQTGAALVVVTIPSMEGGQIDDVTNRLFEKWGVGQADKDNGVMLLVAVKERKMRIEVGYGLESVIPDGVAGSIRDDYVLSYFKKGHMATGIEAGTLALANRMADHYGVTVSAKPSKPKWKVLKKDDDWAGLFIFLFIAAYVIRIIVRSYKGGYPHDDDDDYFGGGGSRGGWYSRNSRSSWYGSSSRGGFSSGGGFGGGGFGGFGGGSSGGGGASGGW